MDLGYPILNGGLAQERSEAAPLAKYGGLGGLQVRCFCPFCRSQRHLKSDKDLDSA